MDDTNAEPNVEPTAEPEVEQIQVLPLVALRDTVIFPEMIVPLQVGREKSVAALNAAVAEGGPIALVTQRQAEQDDHIDRVAGHVGEMGHAHQQQQRPGRGGQRGEDRQRPKELEGGGHALMTSETPQMVLCTSNQKCWQPLAAPV